jgi:ribosomal-protein-alanine N-acetyltransferase
MSKIEIRYQRVSDAKRFFEILSSPNFEYLSVSVKSLEEEKAFLRKNREKRKNNSEHNYAILYDDKVVGAIGLRINMHRGHVSEVGYFVDENYWGKGIATKALKLIERKAFREFEIYRIQAVIHPKNKASVRVAVKCGYSKEGLMKGIIRRGSNRVDGLLYAKVS